MKKKPFNFKNLSFIVIILAIILFILLITLIILNINRKSKPDTTPGTLPMTTIPASIPTTPGTLPMTTIPVSFPTTPGTLPMTTIPASIPTTPGTLPMTTIPASIPTTPGTLPMTTIPASIPTTPGTLPLTTTPASIPTTPGTLPLTTTPASIPTTPGTLPLTTTPASIQTTPGTLPLTTIPASFPTTPGTFPFTTIPASIPTTPGTLPFTTLPGSIATTPGTLQFTTTTPAAILPIEEYVKNAPDPYFTTGITEGKVFIYIFPNRNVPDINNIKVYDNNISSFVMNNSPFYDQTSQNYANNWQSLTNGLSKGYLLVFDRGYTSYYQKNIVITFDTSYVSNQPSHPSFRNTLIIDQNANLSSLDGNVQIFQPTDKSRDNICYRVLINQCPDYFDLEKTRSKINWQDQTGYQYKFIGDQMIRSLNTNDNIVIYLKNFNPYIISSIKRGDTFLNSWNNLSSRDTLEWYDNLGSYSNKNNTFFLTPVNFDYNTGLKYACVSNKTIVDNNGPYATLEAARQNCEIDYCFNYASCPNANCRFQCLLDRNIPFSPDMCQRKNTGNYDANTSDRKCGANQLGGNVCYNACCEVQKNYCGSNDQCVRDRNC